MTSLRWRFITIAALVIGSIIALIPRNTTQREYDPETGRMRDTSVRQVPIKLGLDLRGGVHLAMEIDTSKAKVDDCADAISRAERVIRTRIDEFGTTEPVVQVSGRCRLIVELPGVNDVARARAVVERTAFLEFRITDARERFRAALPSIDAELRRAGVELPRERDGAQGKSSALGDLLVAGGDSQPRQPILSTLLSPGSIPGEFVVADADVKTVEEVLARPELERRLPVGIDLMWGAPDGGQARDGRGFRTLYAVESRAIINGEELRRAVAGRDEMTSAAEVRFELTRDGGRRFAESTGRNVGNHLAIVLDGRVQGQPPVIQDRIGSTGRISMAGRTLEEANDLALVLRAGALPVPLAVVDQRTIGPTLGADSIRDGIRAALIAVGLVLLVMGMYYGTVGLLAVGGLFLYVLHVLGGLAAFGFTLTLPGLAGFALSIGMAVDANVLIYERIREELANGRTVRSAVNAGFDHAMSAIVDSNVTTALTAMVLYMIGTDSVKGFAITLLVGIAASMVTAVFVTRSFFLLWLKGNPSLGALRRRRLRELASAAVDFIGLRRWTYAGSILMILPGLIWLLWSGATYSIEFTGGALVQVQAAPTVDVREIRSALTNAGLGSAEIQSFGREGEYMVRARLGTTGADADGAAAAVRGALDKGLGAGEYQLLRADAVTPKVGAELQQKALIAVLVSFATTLIYLAFRFQWRFGLAAVLATAHDVAATLAFIRYLDLEVSLVVVAAKLTVLGYSLNDTIVIFDRIREKLKGAAGKPIAAIANRAINETLPRTLLTGGTTIATALILAFLAGPVIRPFALIMAFGIIIGTFSSVFVAAPLLVQIQRRWPSLLPAPRVSSVSRA